MRNWPLKSDVCNLKLGLFKTLTKMASRSNDLLTTTFLQLQTTSSK